MNNINWTEVDSMLTEIHRMIEKVSLDLFRKGWRSSDRDKLISEFNLEDSIDYADQICDKLLFLDRTKDYHEVSERGLAALERFLKNRDDKK